MATEPQLSNNCNEDERRLIMDYRITKFPLFRSSKISSPSTMTSNGDKSTSSGRESASSLDTNFSMTRGIENIHSSETYRRKHRHRANGHHRHRHNNRTNHHHHLCHSHVHNRGHLHDEKRVKYSRHHHCKHKHNHRGHHSHSRNDHDRHKRHRSHKKELTSEELGKMVELSSELNYLKLVNGNINSKGESN